MRVVLIQPPPATEFDKHWARFPVLGLAYIVASLEKAGHEVILLDGKLAKLSTDEICHKAVSAQPDLVGITCMTVEFLQAAQIAGRIRQNLDVPVAVGGAHINAVASVSMRECEHFDYACNGEGEELINELLDVVAGKREAATVDGLIYRNNGSVVENASRDYPDYDELPNPAWHVFEPVDQIPVLTHRGCPFQCTFCGHNSGFRPRYRSPERVIEEIGEIIERYKPSVVRFEDETFGLHMGRTKKIIHGILRNGYHKKVAFSAQTRVDRIDLDFVSLLKKANFETLELGVETGNAEVLREIKKGITLDQVRTAVELAKECQLKVWCKFILGHPNETPATIKDTVNFISRLNPDQLSVSIMTPYPGTPIYDMALRGEGGYRMLATDWRNFDKYSKGVLELESVSLGNLRAYQIWSYVKLYTVNFRFWELFMLVLNHRTLAIEMLTGTVNKLFSEVCNGRGGLKGLS